MKVRIKMPRAKPKQKPKSKPQPLAIVKTKPRQQDLPGMENRRLAEIHDAALTYAEARDDRIAASAPEIEAKQTLLELMNKHKLEHYKFENVEVDLVHEKESVKVKIKPEGEWEAAAAAEPAPKTDGGMPTLPKEQRKAIESL